MNNFKYIIYLFLFFVLANLGACGHSPHSHKKIPFFSQQSAKDLVDEALTYLELNQDRALAQKLVDSFKNSLDLQRKEKNFSWCDCERISDRSRLLLVARIVARAQELAIKTPPVVIASLGSGTLLMEFLIANALVDFDQKNVDFVLVDALYVPDSEELKIAERFKQEMKIRGFHGNIYIFPSMEEYQMAAEKNPKLKADIFFAVDTPDIPKERFNEFFKNVVSKNPSATSYYL